MQIKIPRLSKNGFIISVNYKKLRQSIRFNIESKIYFRISLKNTKIFSHRSRPMPDVDSLMQEWPTQFEELLKEVSHLSLILSINYYRLLLLDIGTTCWSRCWSSNLHRYCLLYVFNISKECRIWNRFFLS